jgi:hypothetical protein
MQAFLLPLPSFDAQQEIPRAAIHESVSHDHTAVLFELPHDTRQELHDQLLHLIVLSLALSLALALSLVLLLVAMIFLLPTILLLLLSSIILGLLLRIALANWRHVRYWPSRQIDIYPPLIRLSVVLQPLLLTYLLHSGLNFLDVRRTMVPLAHNHVEVCLAGRFCVPDPLFENVFGFLHKLTVQVDRVRCDAAFSIVFAKDELGGLFVIFVHGSAMRFAFFGQLVGGGTVTTIVGLFGLCKTIA